MTILATADHPWTGWARRGTGDRWRPVVQAQSEAEAWDLLLGHTENADKCVLAAGRDPNRRANRPVPSPAAAPRA
jgi:hypothetical protein